MEEHCVSPQADVWDVDGTGFQTIPDPELARKLRKVGPQGVDRLMNNPLPAIQREVMLDHSTHHF